MLSVEKLISHAVEF